jgi:Fe-S-cluster containining protein
MSEKYASLDNFNGLSPEQQDLFIKSVIHYRDEYTKGAERTNGISAAVTFHNEIDREIKEGFEKDKVNIPSCHKGCSFCCYIHNEITDDEAQLLMEHSLENNIEIDVNLLKRQQGKTIQDYKTMKGSDRKCVFLSREGECKVYEHRPGTCRKYYVASDPTFCDMDNNKVTDVLVIVSTPAEILFTAAGLASKKYGLMADLLLEKLNEHNGI